MLSASRNGGYMKLQKIAFLTFMVFASSHLSAKTSVLFSPDEGVQAFEKIYKLVSNAKSKVSVTVYSWSDKNVLDALIQASKNGAVVRVALHPTLANTQKIKDYAKEIEENGGFVKIAPMNMHEKFFIIDEEFLINGSANLSTSAKTKYSENIIFHEIESTTEKNLLKEFNQEFAVIWNTAKDMKTANEENADALKVEDLKNEPSQNESGLKSSSMNFSLNKNSSSSKAYGDGKVMALSKKIVQGEHSWLVRDLLIGEIKKAKKSILVSMNHLNIREVSDALVEASARGVDVRLNVDNQEFKTAPNNKEMSPQFVKDWKELVGNKNKEAPVRVKFYSFAPSPKFWYLNHHKYFLIDYDEKDLENTILISGSYNVSETAEHKQFDNMVTYKGLEFKEILVDFKKDFESLWSLGRDENDQPFLDIYSRLGSPYNDLFYIHSTNPISLKWSEAIEVKKKAVRAAPLLFKSIFKHRDCKTFNIKTNEYGGC